MAEVSNLGTPGQASVNGNGAAAPTPVAPIAYPDKTPLGADNIDMDAMKEFSRSQAEAKLAKDPNVYGVVKGKKQNEKVAKEAVEEGSEEESSVEEEVLGTEDTYTEDEEAVDAPPSDSDEDAEEDDGLEEVEEGEEVDGRKYVVAKAGDKALRIPKGATLDIKVNGKVESISVQDALNRASGTIHIERETTRLGRESKTLQQERAQFAEKARIVNENASILVDLCENASPEEVAGFYAHLLGKDPNEVYNGIIRNAIMEAQKYEGLTEAQISLMNENRKLRLEQMVAKRRNQSAERYQSQETERAAIVSEMKKRGVSSEDWDKYASEAQQRIKSGEIDREIKSAKDVIDYIVERKHEVKVDSAILAVNKGLIADSKFKNYVSEIVSKTEGLHRRVMPPKEVEAIVKQAIELQKNALRDTLSKKADRVKQSGRPISQSGKSPKQEKKREPVLLRDHYDRINGIID